MVCLINIKYDNMFMNDQFYEFVVVKLDVKILFLDKQILRYLKARILKIILYYSNFNLTISKKMLCTNLNIVNI